MNHLFKDKLIRNLLFKTSFSRDYWGKTSVTFLPSQLSADARRQMVKSQGTGTAANVHCGLQDKAGNLWFGTTGEGVYLYNGRSFTNFTTKDGLSNNTVWSLLEDKAGNIWFGTRNIGLCRYDGKTFTRFSE